MSNIIKGPLRGLDKLNHEIDLLIANMPGLVLHEQEEMSALERTELRMNGIIAYADSLDITDENDQEGYKQVSDCIAVLTKWRTIGDEERKERNRQTNALYKSLLDPVEVQEVRLKKLRADIDAIEERKRKEQQEQEDQQFKRRHDVLVNYGMAYNAELNVFTLEDLMFQGTTIRLANAEEVKSLIREKLFPLLRKREAEEQQQEQEREKQRLKAQAENQELRDLRWNDRSAKFMEAGMKFDFKSQELYFGENVRYTKEEVIDMEPSLFQLRLEGIKTLNKEHLQKSGEQLEQQVKQEDSVAVSGFAPMRTTEGTIIDSGKDREYVRWILDTLIKVMNVKGKLTSEVGKHFFKHTVEDRANYIISGSKKLLESTDL